MPQQRDAITTPGMGCPPWLAHGTAERLLYDIGLSADAVLEKHNQGIKARMPTLCDPSALPILGTDRQLSQAPGESNASFRIRLQQAFDTWRTAGSRQAVMSQVLTFLQETVMLPGVVPVVGIVGGNLSRSWDVKYNNGQKFHTDMSTASWDWDGTTDKWWRCWLVLYMTLVATGGTDSNATIASAGWQVTMTGLSGMSAARIGQYLTVSGAANAANNGTFQIVDYVSPSSVTIANVNAVFPDANSGSLICRVGYYPTIGPGPVWGAPHATWGDMTRSWGLNCPQTTIDGIRSLLRLWKSANAYYQNIIVCFGGAGGATGAEFSPYSTPGSGNPDGTWGQLSRLVGGVMTQSRLTGSQLGAFDAYCGGSGARVNCTIENVT